MFINFYIYNKKESHFIIKKKVCFVIIKMAESTTTEEPQSFILNIVYEIIQSPINLILVSVISFLVYKIVKGRTNVVNTTYEAPKELPRLRRDFLVEELKPYDGNVSEGNPDGRILVAVNFNVYDVTKGKRFYGPGKFF